MTDTTQNPHSTSERIGKAAQAAWGRLKKSQTRVWGEWMTVGEGLMEGRRFAMQVSGVNVPQGRGYVTAYAEWLSKFRLNDLDNSDRAKLLQIMEERAAVEEWRATLTDNQRRELNNPTTVWRKWTTATRVKKPKKRSAGASATEMGRAQHTIEERDERIQELQEELASAYDGAADDIARAMIDKLGTEKAHAVAEAILTLTMVADPAEFEGRGSDDHE